MSLSFQTRKPKPGGAIFNLGRGGLRALSLITLLVFLVPLSGCPGGGSGETGTIRLGLVAALEGEQARRGTSAEQAARLKVKAVNQAGGIVLEGRKHNLELYLEDGKDNPQTAVAAARKLVNQKSAVALIEALSNDSSVQVARFAESAFVPLISAASTHPETTAGKSFVFRTTVTDYRQGRTLALFAFRDLGVTRAAILFDAAGAYNQTLAKVFRSEFRALGGEITGFEFYTTGERDFRDQLKRIQVPEPELLFLPNNDKEVTLQAVQAREIGLGCFLLGSDGWDTMSEQDLAALEAAYHSTLWAPDEEDDKSRIFINAYKKAYGERPDAVAALTYDSVGLLVEALKIGGKADSRGIREGLAGIKGYRGLTGSLSFEKGGDPVKSVAIMAVKDGKSKFFKAFESE